MDTSFFAEGVSLTRIAIRAKHGKRLLITADNRGELWKEGLRELFRDRGFGFIRTQSGQQVFFHCTNLRDVDFVSLEEGQAVEFELQPGEKGLREQAFELPGCDPPLSGPTYFEFAPTTAKAQLPMLF